MAAVFEVVRRISDDDVKLHFFHLLRRVRAMDEGVGIVLARVTALDLLLRGAAGPAPLAATASAIVVLSGDEGNVSRRVVEPEHGLRSGCVSAVIQRAPRNLAGDLDGGAAVEHVAEDVLATLLEVRLPVFQAVQQPRGRLAQEDPRLRERVYPHVVRP